MNIFSGGNFVILSEEDECTFLKLFHFTTESTIKHVQSGLCLTASGKITVNPKATNALLAVHKTAFLLVPAHSSIYPLILEF